MAIDTTDVIAPSPAAAATANVPDYGTYAARFSWHDARAALSGLPGGGLNIAYEAVDRHALTERSTHTAFRFLRRHGERVEMTYGELATATNRYANALRALGIQPGEAVFHLLGRVPALYVAVLGALKAGNVACTLFSAFGPEPIRQRMVAGNAVALVTTASMYERKIAPVRDQLPNLRCVLIAGPDGATPDGAMPGRDGVVSLAKILGAASDTFTIAPTTADTPALLHFTSGTTGTPKGALHVHEAVAAHHATGWSALDLHGDDIYWCTADPGWVTGTSYGIIAPLVHGVTSIVDEGDLDAERWYRLLADEKVTVWYTAPTAIRMLMKAGADVAAGCDLSCVRFAASVGEPLNPEAVRWAHETLGLVFHDNWWQTETGGIMIGNLASMPVRPGSMGKPLPGITAAVLACNDDGELTVVAGHPVVLEGDDDADVRGVLALRTPWPSMFRAYVGQPERYQHCFVDGWYVSGDVVRRDSDGYYWFVSRADDVIKSAGHLIGPFEVESVLMEHPAVAEAGVYGVPDPVAGAVVHAAVSLHPGFEASDETRRSLIAFGRNRLGAAVAPRAIVFAEVPKTRSGKILRRLLRARELGLPEGDTSTLEGTGEGTREGTLA